MFLLHCGFQKTHPEDILLGSSVHFDFLCFKQTALNDGYTHEDSETIVLYSRAFNHSQRNSFDYLAPTFICFKRSLMFLLQFVHL